MSSIKRATNGQASLSIAPSLIIGLCILGAVIFVVLCAATYRLCRRNRSAMPATEPDINGVFNPNGPRSEAQTERMRQVRWINNSYAWERAKLVRMEMGEKIGPKPKPLNKDGSETESWSIAETSGRHESIMNSSYDYSGAAYYGNNNPYAQANNFGYQRAIPQSNSQLLRPQPMRPEGNQYASHADYEDDDDTLTEPFPPLPEFPIFSNPLPLPHQQDPPMHPAHPYIEQGPFFNAPLAGIAYPPQSHQHRHSQAEQPERQPEQQPREVYELVDMTTPASPATICHLTSTETPTPPPRPKITINDSEEDMARTPVTTQLEFVHGQRYYQENPLAGEREGNLEQEHENRQQEGKGDAARMGGAGEESGGRNLISAPVEKSPFQESVQQRGI